MSGAETQADLDALLAVPATVTAGGLEVQVRAFRFEQLAQVSRLAMPVIEALTRTPEPAVETGARGDPLFTAGFDLLDLFEAHTASLQGLIALSTGLPQDWVAGLPIDEGIDLLDRLLVVNERFFARALPKLMRMAVQMTLGRSAFPPPTSSAAPAADTPPPPPESAPGPATPTSS